MCCQILSSLDSSRPNPAKSVSVHAALPNPQQPQQPSPAKSVSVHAALLDVSGAAVLPCCRRAGASLGSPNFFSVRLQQHSSPRTLGSLALSIGPVCILPMATADRWGQEPPHGCGAGTFQKTLIDEKCPLDSGTLPKVHGASQEVRLKVPNSPASVGRSVVGVGH